MLEKFVKDSIKKMISNLTGNKLDGILSKILWKWLKMINILYIIQ